jgi:hypothetical protein
VKKFKIIPLTGRRGPQGYEMSRIQRFQTIGSQLAVRLSALSTDHALPLPGRFLVVISVGGYAKPGAIVQLEGLGKLKKKKKSDLIGNRTRDLPACNIAPRPANATACLSQNQCWL